LWDFFAFVGAGLVPARILGQPPAFNNYGEAKQELPLQCEITYIPC